MMMPLMIASLMSSWAVMLEHLQVLENMTRYILELLLLLHVPVLPLELPSPKDHALHTLHVSASIRRLASKLWLVEVRTSVVSVG